MFLNTIMLAGIGGAALPLVVHLLSRARVRTVDWGAMMFLEDGHATQEQAARFKQWTLLLLRMGMVALLAVALARPIAAGRWGAPPGPLTAVIVVDCSASMAQPTGGGRTRMDAAREAVLRILSGLRKGDRAALLVAGAGQSRRSILQPSADLQAVAARAAELKPSAGATDLRAALTDAAGIFDRDGAANQRLYVVSDTQASTWTGLDTAFGKSWRDRATRGGRATPFDLIVVGESGSTDNIAVESVSLAGPPAVAGLAFELEVKVRRFAAAPSTARTQVPLTVRSAGGEVFKGTVDVAADDSASINFPVRIDTRGQHTLTAQVTSPTLPSDDRMQFVVDILPPVRVLIVSGDERGGGGGGGGGGGNEFRSESDFLRTALVPYAAISRAGTDPARVTVVPIEKWADAATGDADVIVLANIAELTPQQVRSLEAFVYSGGGLLVAPGGTSRPQSYNRSLYRDGAGLLPAMFSGQIADRTTSLLGIELTHPIFRFLRGRPDPIPSAIFTRLLDAAPGKGAAVLASYVSGQPFLIEGAYGRGRVLLLTTTVDADWNTLPLTSFYLPFAQSAVRYLAAVALPQRNLLPGEEIRARFTEAPEGVRATVTAPDGRRYSLQASGSEGNYEVSHSETDLPGPYTLRTTVSGTERVERYVVRHPLHESDLKPMEPGEWDRLQEALGFRRVRSGSTTGVLPVATVGPQGRELWLPGLLGVLLLGMAELTLTRLWSEGRW